MLTFSGLHKPYCRIIYAFGCCAQSFSRPPDLCDTTDCHPPGSSVHGDSPGKNTRVGCHALLQGIFPTQGLNPSLPHCTWILYHLNHQGNPCSAYQHTQENIRNPNAEASLLQNLQSTSGCISLMLTGSILVVLQTLSVNCGKSVFHVRAFTCVYKLRKT